MQTNLSLRDAQLAVLDRIELLQAEIISTQLAYGRVLAETIVSTRTIPPGDCSAMDGYAVIASDLEKVPVTLTIAAYLPAGATFDGTLKPGQAARIFTGASVPAGANAIVMQEYTNANDDFVTIEKSVEEGHYIRPAGLDFKLRISVVVFVDPST